MAARNTDWEAIHREYCVGQKSARTLGDQYGIAPSTITRKAKKEGWIQDKTDEVRQRTKAGLLRRNTERNTPRNTPKKCNTPTREDIEIAVQTNIEVIRDHRKQVKKGRELVELLFGQLEHAAVNRDEIESDIVDDTATGGPKQTGGIDKKRRNAMMKAVSLPSHSGALRDLSTALKNLIPLERQAFNLDDDGMVSVDEVVAVAEKINPKLGEVIRKGLKNG